ncbi:MAG: Lipoteichoic acid synthase 1, partial [Chlamydiae bacterium]|nr:Lipoteichoic acid synthase 1 [Chlamydiota bacterium]
MAAIWTFLFLLALPSLSVRFAILHRNLPVRSSLFISYLTGVCQDLFVAFQQLFFLILFKSLIPFSGPYLFWLFVVVSSLLMLHMIFDAFLHRNAAIRMEVSFFSFIDDIRCFWDSAKEKKIWRFIPGTLLFLCFPIFTYWHCWGDLKGLTLQTDWIALGLSLGAIGALGSLFLPKKLAYATDHVVFQHEVWFLKKLYRFLKRKNDRTDIGHLARSAFKVENEKKSYPSSEYPLLKYTYGFSGDKGFDLRVEEGERPHVIFLFLESFRAKDVGCLGGERGVTPHFDRLAKEGVLFSNFYANSVRTSRSVVSSLFGLPSDVDGSEAAARVKFPFIGIPQLMQNAGYQTSYLHNGPIGFENQDLFFNLHSYDAVLGKDDIAADFPEMDATSWGLPDECLMDYAANFLEKRRETPQFLTLFTITNHHPWNLPKDHQPPAFPPEISRIYRKYLNTFHYTDASLGRLIDLLKEKDLAKDTLLFILGDHGYPMGEHENFVEQRYLYEENIRVPLLIYADGRIPEPKVIDGIASQLDLVPTLMDLLDLHGLNLSIGSSLLRPLKERRIFFHNPYVFKNYGCREGKYKFIFTRLSNELELYDLESDPL